MDNVQHRLNINTMGESLTDVYRTNKNSLRNFKSDKPDRNAKVTAKVTTKALKDHRRKVMP
jgi:hypothetical protein